MLETTARFELLRRLRLGTLSLALSSAAAGSAHATPAAAPPAAAASPAAGAEGPESDNAAPQILRLLPARYDQEHVRVRAGAKLELTIVAEDADGDPLAATALGLPAGAVFDPAVRRLSWTPTAAQTGDHVVILHVSDGTKEATRTVSLEVIQNHAPIFFQRAYTLAVGQFGRLVFGADDRDDDVLSYRLAKLPAGATFDPVLGVLQWRPAPGSAGKHRFKVSVSDGMAQTEAEFEVEVAPASDDAWATFLQPGVGAAGYFPRDPEAGGFFGGSLRLSLLSWIHRSEAPGPGYGRIYIGGELLKSSEPELSAMFSYGVGFEVSFERNPTRTVLIPMYGLELGGLVHDELGSPFQLTPFGGLELFGDADVSLSARGGYRVVPARFERLSGAHLGLSLDAHLW